MVKVVIVGEAYYGDRSPDQGLPPVSPGYPDQGLPGGGWGGRPPRPDQGLPGGGLRPSHPIVLPPGSISGTPEHPIYTPPGAPSHPIVLPPGSVSGTPEHPIYYPPYPDQGLPGFQPYPDQGLPGRQPYPDQGLPWPGRPVDPGYGIDINRPDQGLPVPPGTLPPLPELPPDLESKVVVAVHKPGQGWTVKAYPIGPDQGLPGAGQPQPKA